MSSVKYIKETLIIQTGADILAVILVPYLETNGPAKNPVALIAADPRNVNSFIFKSLFFFLFFN